MSSGSQFYTLAVIDADCDASKIMYENLRFNQNLS